MIPPGTFDLLRNLRQPVVPPETFDLFKNLRQPVIPPGTFDLLRNLRQPVIPPQTFDFLRYLLQPIIPSDPLTAEKDAMRTSGDAAGGSSTPDGRAADESHERPPDATAEDTVHPPSDAAESGLTDTRDDDQRPSDEDDADPH